MHYCLMQKDLLLVPERASVTGQFYAIKVLPEVVKHNNNALVLYNVPGVLTCFMIMHLLTSLPW